MHGVFKTVPFRAPPKVQTQMPELGTCLWHTYVIKGKSARGKKDPSVTPLWVEKSSHKRQHTKSALCDILKKAILWRQKPYSCEQTDCREKYCVGYKEERGPFGEGCD